jgi:hypothetical protein
MKNRHRFSIIIAFCVGGTFAGYSAIDAQTPNSKSKICPKPDRHSSEEVDSRLKIAGLGNPADVKQFINRLVIASEPQNRTELARMVRYPLRVHKAGKVIMTYKTTQSVVRDFTKIFTPKVKFAIHCAQYDTLFINYQGAMLGDGELWFNNFDGKLLISAINS